MDTLIHESERNIYAVYIYTHEHGRLLLYKAHSFY